MSKKKTSELSGAALDFAVAKCEGEPLAAGRVDNFSFEHDCNPNAWLCYSTSWGAGGPIIERENILLNPQYPSWASTMRHVAKPNTNSLIYHGPTPLIAAMRCFVASKLGDEVEIPEELV